jgi:radical SAM protein with 4Fe4S-binding SPASM domain
MVSPLSPEERARLQQAPRPRHLPLAPIAKPAKRKLPLAEEVRPIDQRVRPIYAVWEITLACDLACRHCGSRAGKPRPEELSTEECLNLVDQMAAMDVKEVSLIGGEAYLRDDWTQIIARIAKHGMTPLLTSGGRGITKERARAAKDAGLRTVSISIDGDEAAHDRLRGVQGSYRSALESIANLREVGIPVSCNTQINRLSIPHLEGVLELMGKLGLHSWQIQLTVAMGRAADEPEVLLQPYDLLDLFPLLAKLKQRCDELKIRMWPGNNIGYFGPYESVLRGTMPKGHMYSCGAGRSTLGIEADGSIKGCPSLTTDPWVGGNIRDASLKDIWERAPALRYTRDRTVEDLWGFCHDCYYADECRAGCTWTAQVLFGKPGNNPFCHHRALEMDRKGMRERIVKMEEAPGEPFDHGRFEIVVEPKPETQSAPFDGKLGPSVLPDLEPA